MMNSDIVTISMRGVAQREREKNPYDIGEKSANFFDVTGT